MFKLKPGWTKQKVMDQVKKYNDDNRAHQDNSCVYNAEDGNRCAIGCFIPDGHEALMFEGPVTDPDSPQSGFSLIGAYPELLEYMPFENFKALARFQRTHDDAIGSVYDAIQEFLDTQVEE